MGGFYDIIVATHYRGRISYHQDIRTGGGQRESVSPTTLTRACFRCPLVQTRRGETVLFKQEQRRPKLDATKYAQPHLRRHHNASQTLENTNLPRGCTVWVSGRLSPMLAGVSLFSDALSFLPSPTKCRESAGYGKIR